MTETNCLWLELQGFLIYFSESAGQITLAGSSLKDQRLHNDVVTEKGIKMMATLGATPCQIAHGYQILTVS